MTSCEGLGELREDLNLTQNVLYDCATLASAMNQTQVQRNHVGFRHGPIYISADPVSQVLTPCERSFLAVLFHP